MVKTVRNRFAETLDESVEIVKTLRVGSRQRAFNWRDRIRAEGGKERW